MSTQALHPRMPQNQRQAYRQLCSPGADRLPAWLRRVWAWF